MNYKALLTRMYSMADESLQIVIEDTDTFSTFKTRVFDALKITDHRANVQMQRLFEDSNFTDSLGYDDLRHARKAAELMYPVESVPSKLNLGPGTAFEFAKNLASGEVVKIFLHDVESYEELSSAIQDVWNLIDARLKRTNDRELKFMEYYKSLPHETKLKITMCMDILFGRTDPESVIQRLKGKTAEELDSYIEEMRQQPAQQGGI